MRDQLGPTPGICVVERDHPDRRRPVDRTVRVVGTDIPIVSPNELLAARPDPVLLTLPDLLPEVSTRFPELDGRWAVDSQ
jgi:hypothetical protein